MVSDNMTERLIVGLDLPNVADAEKAVRDLDGVASFYKIGTGWPSPADWNSPATSSPTARASSST